MLKKTLTLFLFVSLASCTKYKLNDEDLKWIPYKENEVLYLSSSYGDHDSIILSKPERYFDEPGWDGPFDYDKIEVIDVMAERIQSQNSSYVWNNFFRLYANDEGETYLSLNIQGKDAKTDPTLVIDLEEFKKLKIDKLTTSYSTFYDVVTFYPDTTNITKVY